LIKVMDKNSINENRAFEGKNILITGTSKGIGKAVARELSMHGANIILLSNNETLLDRVYDEIIETTNTTPCIIKCDLSNLDEVKTQEIVKIISQDYKVLDCIIHNAATIEKMSNIEDFDLKSWEKILKVNLTSSFLLTKFLLPLLKLAKNPRLIFTSSGVGYEGKAYWGAYSVSKGGSKILSEILSDELEHIENFKVFNFNPMATRTDMRATAFPAEDPNQIKSVDKLLPYYKWMVSEISNKSKSVNISYGDQI